MSVLRVNGRLNRIFVAERKRIRVSFLVNREWLYEIAKQEVKRSQKKTPETDPSDQPIRSVSRRQIHRISQSEAFPEDMTIFRLVQSDPSGRTYKSDTSSKNHIPFSSNQIPSDGLQTDHLLSCPIRFLRTDFRRTIFRLVQSNPSDGLSDGPSSI